MFDSKNFIFIFLVLFQFLFKNANHFVEQRSFSFTDLHNQILYFIVRDELLDLFLLLFLEYRPNSFFGFHINLG